MLHNDITGVILAGGKGQRMGGRDKGLIEFRGKPLIRHVIDIIQPQVADVIISANRHIEEYNKYGFKVFPDQMGDYWGPLAGIASAMRQVETPYLLTVPCDTPFLSKELVDRLSTALMEQHKYLAVAHDGNRLQNTIALIPCRLVDDLVDFLLRGERKTQTWLECHAPAIVDFSDQPSMFVNINTPEDCQKLEAACKS